MLSIHYYWIDHNEFLKTMTNVKNGGVINLHAVDYLRSKGYAIPFMEYSVEELVNLGWMRLVISLQETY